RVAAQPADALSQRGEPGRGFFEDRGLESPVRRVAPVLRRRAPQAVALAPFLLAFGMLALERFAPVDFAPVALPPFAPSARREEGADQQPEHEDQDADRPQVRVGGDVHGASPMTMEPLRLRFSAPQRSVQPWRKLSLIEQLAGPK